MTGGVTPCQHLSPFSDFILLIQSNDDGDDDGKRKEIKNTCIVFYPRGHRVGKGLL